jgi:chemotaxis protein histidine kinase CheA
MAAKAQEISQEAGSKMAAAMKDVVNAAAGIAGFAIESTRDLVQYMVRRGQMTQEEADKLIREAEAFQGKRKPGAARPPLAPPAPAARPAPPALAPRPAQPAAVAKPAAAAAKAAPAAKTAKPAAAAKPAAKPAARPVAKAAAKTPAKSASRKSVKPAPAKGGKKR